MLVGLSVVYVYTYCNMFHQLKFFFLFRYSVVLVRMFLDRWSTRTQRSREYTEKDGL